MNVRHPGGIQRPEGADEMLLQDAIWPIFGFGLLVVVAVVGAIAVAVKFIAKHFMSQSEAEILRERCTSSEKDNRELREDNKKLKSQSHRDHLTEVPNRRGLMDQLTIDLARAERYRSPVSVLFFDADGFKTVNDELGHKFGDTVLIDLAQVLEGGTRAGEIVARYGGDEFVIIIVGADAGADLIAGERFRRLVEEKVFHKNHEITVSVGVARWEPGMPVETLLERADQAMYAAKAAGGNTVKMYQSA